MIRTGEGLVGQFSKYFKNKYGVDILVGKEASTGDDIVAVKKADKHFLAPNGIKTWTDVFKWLEKTCEKNFK